MASLYVIRHGKTDWNEIKRIQGSTDTSLNDEGIGMARKAHDEYEGVRFDICFCSPLKRARQTAELLLEGRDIPIEYDDRLRELSFGEFEGVDIANTSIMPRSSSRPSAILPSGSRLR